MKQTKTLTTITILLSLALWTAAFAQSLITIRRAPSGGGGGGGGFTQLASDNFNTNGSLDAYATWVVGFDCEDPQVVAGVLQGQNAGGWACALNTTTMPNDQYGQVTLVAASTDNGKVGAVTVRHQTGSSQYYVCIVYGPLGTSSARWEIARKTNGAGYVVINSADNQTITAGSTLWCQVVGDTITMKINGSTVGTGSGASAFASGSVGLFVRATTTLSAAQIDDWSGGSIP